MGRSWVRLPETYPHQAPTCLSPVWLRLGVDGGVKTLLGMPPQEEINKVKKKSLSCASLFSSINMRDCLAILSKLWPLIIRCMIVPWAAKKNPSINYDTLLNVRYTPLWEKWKWRKRSDGSEGVMQHSVRLTHMERFWIHILWDHFKMLGMDVCDLGLVEAGRIMVWRLWWGAVSLSLTVICSWKKDTNKKYRRPAPVAWKTCMHACMFQILTGWRNGGPHWMMLSASLSFWEYTHTLAVNK